jgi:hypothetical protein
MDRYTVEEWELLSDDDYDGAGWMTRRGRITVLENLLNLPSYDKEEE